MKYKYDKTNNVYYYRCNVQKRVIARSATPEGLEKKLEELGMKAIPNLDRHDITVADAFELFLKEKQPPEVRQKTYNDYKNFIKIYDAENNLRIDNKLIKDKKLVNINREYMKAVLKLLLHRYSNKSEISINHWYGILKNALNVAYIHFKFQNNPMTDKSLKFDYEKKRGWSPTREGAIQLLEAVDKFMTHSTGGGSDYRSKSIWLKQKFMGAVGRIRLDYDVDVIWKDSEVNVIDELMTIIKMAPNKRAVIEPTIIKKITTEDIRVDMLAMLKGLTRPKARLLLEHFGCIMEIGENEVSDILKIKGVGKVTAERLLNILNSEEKVRQ